MSLDEGYIKFNLQWKKSAPLDTSLLEEIIEYRNKCFDQGFIGVYRDSGLGYGNISTRYKGRDQFIISGTQTGHLPNISTKHFTLVTHVNFEQNKVVCKGPVKASAESLTHAIFYNLDPQINCVIHIHQLELWQRLLFKVPTTAADIPYGTVEMCTAVEDLYSHFTLPEQKILVMGGHKEGIISFGKNFREAYETLINA